MKAPILYLVAVATFKNVSCCPSSLNNPIIIGPTKDPNMKYVLVVKNHLFISFHIMLSIKVKITKVRKNLEFYV